MTVVTRFAPSPTGELHLGSAYSALVAWKRGSWIPTRPQRDARARRLAADQKAGRPPPVDTTGNGSRDGSGRPLGLNTAAAPRSSASAAGR